MTTQSWPERLIARAVPTAARLRGGLPWLRRLWLPRRPSASVEFAPRDARWGAGLAIVGCSLLLLGFVGQVVVGSGLQHQRATLVSYNTLRESLAKGETPVGQLDVNSELVVPGTPVALLQIPKLGISEVIGEGTTAAVLRSGPGHRRDSVMPGQVGTSVILGRQLGYGGPFQNLSALVAGDEINVTTGQGVHTYRVFSLRRSGDPLPTAISASEGRLELDTADGVPLFPTGVLHVDAVLVSASQAASARVLTYPALPTSERAMGADAAAWPAAIAALFAFGVAMVAIRWLWRRWGWRQAWLIGVPVLLALGAACSDLIIDALPNLL
jgi:sortase A